jgi:hypothetical protein
VPALLLQVTGDILSLTTGIGGPVLPGFGPTVFAERANAAATGLAAATEVAGLGKAGRAGSGAGGDAGDGSMPQAVVDFLMPPQAINADIVSQVRAAQHSSVSSICSCVLVPVLLLLSLRSCTVFHLVELTVNTAGHQTWRLCLTICCAAPLPSITMRLSACLLS